MDQTRNDKGKLRLFYSECADRKFCEESSYERGAGRGAALATSRCESFLRVQLQNWITVTNCRVLMKIKCIRIMTSVLLTKQTSFKRKRDGKVFKEIYTQIFRNLHTLYICIAF